MCYFYCSACISPHSCFWLCLPCIMNYQLCMTHGLTTANRHDHAWSDKWAQNISTLSRQMSLMRLWCDHQDLGWRGHLYETKGTWKNSPTCCTLLNVGFMIVLRRAGWYVLIWARKAVPTNLQLSSFQTSQLFRTKPEKLFQCISALPMLFSKTMLWSCMVGLIQLQTSTRVICFQGHGPRWCQG